MAEKLITLWSESVTFSAAVATFPGVTEKSVYDVNDSPEFYGTNGTWLQWNGAQGGTIINANHIEIVSTAGVIPGMYIYLRNFSVDGLPGYFKIIEVDSATVLQIATSGLAALSGFVDSQVCDYYIGGISDAFDTTTTLQDELDFIGPACGATDGDATNSLDILCFSAATLTITATIDIDNISGSTTTRVRLIATNGDFLDDGTKVKITTNDVIGGDGLFNIATGISGVWFYNFILDANEKADYVLRTTDACFTQWHDCVFENAVLDNIGNDSGGNIETLILYNPIIRNAGRHGVSTISSGDNLVSIRGGKVYGNIGTGIQVSNSPVILENVLIYGNAIGVDMFFNSHSITNCTIDDNSVAGLVWDGTPSAVSANIKITNCSITNNAVDFLPSGTAYQACRVYNCCLNGNDATHEIPFVNAMEQRDIITGDPLYADPDNVDLDLRDYTPSNLSPLIDAGIAGTGDTIGALCAEAGGGGAGGLLTHPGISGRIQG